MRARRGAVITGHIPPVLDEFRFKMEWLQPYADRYVGIVAAYHDVVGAQLFGHTHQNMLRAFPTLRRRDAQGPPLLVTAAVTPVYGNNPTWRALELEKRTGVVLDYGVHAADLDAASASAHAPLVWTERFRARERYAPHDVFSSDGLRAFAAALLVDDVRAHTRTLRQRNAIRDGGAGNAGPPPRSGPPPPRAERMAPSPRAPRGLAR